MSVLLRQPDGFEGLGPRLEGAPPDALSAPPPDHEPGRLVRWGGAARTVTAKRGSMRTSGHQDRALPRCRRGSRERHRPVVPPAASSVVAAVAASPSMAPRRGTISTSSSDQRQIGVEVAPVEGVKGSASKLHVLLRHRLLGQPHGFEGFGSIGEYSTIRRTFVSHRPDLRRLASPHQRRCPSPFPRYRERRRPWSPASTNSSSSPRKLSQIIMSAIPPLDPGVTPIDIRRRRHRAKDQLDAWSQQIEESEAEARPKRSQVHGLGERRTISTFSCDIARAVSRRLRSQRERLAPTALWLRLSASRELRPWKGRRASSRSCHRARHRPVRGAR